MKTLHINFMNNLQNHEFTGLYIRLCDSIDEEQLDNSEVKNACKEVKSQCEEIKQMTPDPRSHELTEVINKLIHKRTGYLTSLRMHVNAFELSPCEEQVVAAKVLTYWLQQQGEELYRPTITVQSCLARNLMHVREQKPEISKAIIFLRFDSLMDAIVDTNNQIHDNVMQRNKELSARTKKSKVIRKAAYREFKIFVRMLDVFVNLKENRGKETIYHLYSRRIDRLLTYFNTQLKSRTTKTRNKKEIAAAVKELINSQIEPQKMLPEGINEELKHDPSTGSGAIVLNKSESVEHPLRTYERKGTAEATLVAERSVKDQVINGKFYIKNGSEDSALTKKDKKEEWR